MKQWINNIYASKQTMKTKHTIKSSTNIKNSIVWQKHLSKLNKENLQENKMYHKINKLIQNNY